MSSTYPAKTLTFRSGAAIAKGVAVMPGADQDHVLVSAASTSLNIGIAQTETTDAEGAVEIAVHGGGGKALLGASVFFGDLLAPTSDGSLVATITGGDRVIAMALEDGDIGDMISVMVMTSFIGDHSGDGL